MAYTVPAPELAKMVIRTCSFMLNGPGFNVNSQRVPLKNTLSVNVAAIRCPIGTTAICADIAVMDSGSFRYQKNWFKKDSSTHERVPSTHMRNVKQGIVGSSPVGTVNATCSMGEFCSSFPADEDVEGSFAGTAEELRILGDQKMPWRTGREKY